MVSQDLVFLQCNTFKNLSFFNKTYIEFLQHLVWWNALIEKEVGCFQYHEQLKHKYQEILKKNQSKSWPPPQKKRKKEGQHMCKLQQIIILFYFQFIWYWMVNQINLIQKVTFWLDNSRLRREDFYRR